MDGDKRSKRSDHEDLMKRELGDRMHHSATDFTSYLNERMSYLPGNTWPEKHLLNDILCQNSFSGLNEWGISEDDLKSYCQEALSAGKHNEIYTLSNKLGIEKQTVYSDVVRFYKRNHHDEIKAINDFIRNLMS